MIFWLNLFSDDFFIYTQCRFGFEIIKSCIILVLLIVLFCLWSIRFKFVMMVSYMLVVVEISISNLIFQWDDFNGYLI